MQQIASVAGVVSFSTVGVAYADGPGGWSQFNDVVNRAPGQSKAAQAQQAPQKTTERDCRHDISRLDGACRYTDDGRANARADKANKRADCGDARKSSGGSTKQEFSY